MPRPALGTLLTSLLLALASACAHLPRCEDDAGFSPRPRPAAYPGARSTSTYLRMKDGVLLAVQLTLPDPLPASERLPVILRQTRYWRAHELHWPFSALVQEPLYGKTREHLVRQGYAWVDVDLRGTGASFGVWSHPWSPEHQSDTRQVLDWIVSQPWSSGHVGVMGISYDGMLAELTASLGHPAVKAIAPRFAAHDTYADATFFGGAENRWLGEQWNLIGRALDANALEQYAGSQVGMAVRGVEPVQGDRQALQRALSERSGNFDLAAAMHAATFRDDESARWGIEGFSPAAFTEAVRSSGVAVLAQTSWFDAAYARSALRRHGLLEADRSQVVIGPWDHGGQQNLSPFCEGPVRFSHEALLVDFFDAHLKRRQDVMLPPIAYFTLGEERWKTAESWPPPGVTSQALYLREGHTLSPEAPPAGAASDTYRVNGSAGTGNQGRWDTLINPLGRSMRYPDRAEADRLLLTYTSAPLGEDLELAGEPVLSLVLESSAEDGAVFAYLEDVVPDGRVSYVTEGALRLIHRTEAPAEAQSAPEPTYLRQDSRPLTPGTPVRAWVALLPTSYRFPKGHAVRLAVAGADKDHFATYAAGAEWKIHHSAEAASRLVLPVVGNGRVEIR